MFTTNEQFSAFNKSSVDALQSLANTALYGAERIAALKINTTRLMLEDGAANTKALFEAKSLPDVMALQSAPWQPALEQITAYNRSLYEILSQSRDEVYKLFESQVVEFQKQVFSALDSASKNAPAGSEVAVAAVKSTFTVANSALDSMNKAIKHANEFAEANIATASNAAISTVRSANAKKKVAA